MNTRYLITLFSLFLLIGCDDMNDLPSALYMEPAISAYSVESDETMIDVVITSSSKIEVTAIPGWIAQEEMTVSGNKHIFSFEVESNISLDNRTGEIKFKSGNKECEVTVAQQSYPSYVPSTSMAGLEETFGVMDLQVVETGVQAPNGVIYDKKGTANSERQTAPFYRAFDGKYTGDIYYSWQYKAKDTPADYWPVKMDLYLSPSSSVFDHVMYYAPAANGMGAFGRTELWVSKKEQAKEDSDFEKVGEIDLNCEWGTGKKLAIPAEVQTANVRTVRIAVHNAGINYNASLPDEEQTICIGTYELEAFGMLPLNFDTSDLFADPSCSALKEGISVSDILDYEYPLFMNIAYYLYLGLYPTERIWDVAAKAEATRTTISVAEGQNMIVTVKDTYEKEVTMQIINAETSDIIASYPLTTGANKISNCKGGIIQILYPEGTQPIRINFPTGSVIQ